MTKNDRDGKMFPTSTSEEETCQNNGGTARVVAMGKCPVEELQIQADFVEVISL